MKNYALLIFCSLLLCSFQYSGEIDYWKALKGVKNIKYGKYTSGGMKIGKIPARFKKISFGRTIRENCHFPKSAKQLDSKKIQITGWIDQSMGRRKYALAKRPFDLENMEKAPSLDEKIELDGSFKQWCGQKVRITGILRLNQENGRRHFYILENIEQIEGTK
ncbi:MAG: hypothetical protein ACI976_001133 [Aureispira sp.]|jgi:hypothetical protein